MWEKPSYISIYEIQDLNTNYVKTFNIFSFFNSFILSFSLSLSYIYIYIYIYIYVPKCFRSCKIDRWFLGCPAYQSGPGKDGFLIDVSMASQSSSSRSLLAASRSRLLRLAARRDLEEDDWDVIETSIRNFD